MNHYPLKQFICQILKLMQFCNSTYIKILLLVFICYSIPFSLEAQENIEYQRFYLSGKDASTAVAWDFMVTEGSKSGVWSTIPVPSNWELYGFGTYNYGHDHKNKEVKLGKEHGRYKHKFSVPKDWKGKTVNIVFDGSMTDTKVKVNGKSAGKVHQGAFYRFKYDITKLLKFGSENILEVDVAKHSANESVNRAERQADFWIFGGIFRPVFLEILPNNHFERIAIDAKEDGHFSAFVSLNRKLKGAMARVKVLSADGSQIGPILEKNIDRNTNDLVLGGNFNGVKSWNPEFPELYTAVFEIFTNGKTVYKKEEKFGFRTVELRKKDGFYINGERVIFKGVNRHSFWPTTGRALSNKNNMQDIMLMKEMNMNAVRMSHYSPDERFLQLCDSLGLFVLDELTGWQNGYDTIIGPKLIKELILKDENHPSVVIWDHGNEGGWEFANDKWFHQYDRQKRPVIYPWLKRNGVDTRHYPDYNYGINNLADGHDVFMPTEFLHGLYDGGHGAGLEDFWNKYQANPLLAGGFLWSFSDEAVMRTDKNNELDSYGSDAPDGILGPHREREASFYTIKEVWSPIQIKPKIVRADFDGKLMLSNEYIYSNLNTCTFSWQIMGVDDFSPGSILASGTLPGPDIAPGETRAIHLSLPKDISSGSIFLFTAIDQYGKEVYTWTWDMKQPKEQAGLLLPKLQNDDNSNAIEILEEADFISATANKMKFRFDKKNGFLSEVKKDGNLISLNGGPLPVGLQTEPKQIDWRKNKDGDFLVEVGYDSYPEKVTWSVKKSGLLRLEVSPLNINKDSLDYIGISFNYPEEKVKGIEWMGKGPYRVWKNRTKGAELGVWQKDYNNTVTGGSFENLIYPEFKGYHANLYWAKLETSETPISIITETPGLYLRLFTPKEPPENRGGTVPGFPEGNISFLYDIPSIGTKFKKTHEMGPSASPGLIEYREDDKNDPIILWFDFGNGIK